MNNVDMTLKGSRQAGWQWEVTIDGAAVYRTVPLTLNDLSWSLATVQRDAERRNPLFDEVADDRLAFLLSGFFAGEFTDALRTSAEEQVWAKHRVAPALPTEVGMFLFLIEGAAEDTDRLIVADGAKTHTFHVPRGRFDALLRDIRARLEAPTTR